MLLLLESIVLFFFVFFFYRILEFFWVLIYCFCFSRWKMQLHFTLSLPPSHCMEFSAAARKHTRAHVATRILPLFYRVYGMLCCPQRLTHVRIRGTNVLSFVDVFPPTIFCFCSENEKKKYNMNEYMKRFTVVKGIL